MAGGRPKGSTGINRQAVLKSLQERMGADWNPIADMAELAQTLVKAAKTNPRLAVDAINSMDKVAKYLLPQLKSVEMDLSSSDGSMTPPKAIRLIAVPVGETPPEIAQRASQEVSGVSKAKLPTNAEIKTQKDALEAIKQEAGKA